MANLLSDEDRAAFLASVQDTTDTFMRQPVTFQLRTRSLSLFNDGNRAGTVTEKTVAGLFVQGQQVVETGAGGAVDLGDGYVLCNRTDLAAQGLADAGGLLSVTARVDTLVVAGETYSILAVVPLGPLAGVYTLGKFITQKKLRANT